MKRNKKRERAQHLVLRCVEGGRKEELELEMEEVSTYPRADQREHDAFVESQRFALFHFDAFLIQAFHGVHFARVGFPATVDFAKTAATDDPVNAKIVHRQL